MKTTQEHMCLIKQKMVYMSKQNKFSIFLILNIPIATVTNAMLGVILVIFGNYLPKSRQNYTVGIKLPWTLDNVDNWSKTHRLAGYMYIFGGIAIITVALLSSFGRFYTAPVVIFIAVLLVTVPILYPYTIYRKKQSQQKCKKISPITFVIGDIFLQQCC